MTNTTLMEQVKIERLANFVLPEETQTCLVNYESITIPLCNLMRLLDLRCEKATPYELTWLFAQMPNVPQVWAQQFNAEVFLTPLTHMTWPRGSNELQMMTNLPILARADNYNFCFPQKKGTIGKQDPLLVEPGFTKETFRVVLLDVFRIHHEDGGYGDLSRHSQLTMKVNQTMFLYKGDAWYDLLVI